MKTKIIYRLFAAEIWLMTIWFGILIYCILSNTYFPIMEMTFFLAFIVFTFFSLVFALGKVKKKCNEYEEDQYLAEWYEKTMKRNGFKWIKHVGDKLNVLYGKNLKILSVAANKGTYEKEMYMNMIKNGNILHMMVTEIGRMEHEKNSEDGASKFEYFSEVDAFNCVDFLRSSGIQYVNAIFDFKGAFWYQLTKKHGTPEKLLEEYIKALKGNGAIIIDMINQPFIRKVLYYTKHIFLGMPGTEQSTFFHLKKKMFKNPRFRKFILKNFIIEKHVADAAKRINIVILKKRAV